MPKCFGRKPQWAFVVETLTDGEYESTYGKKPDRGFEDSSDGWAQDGFVSVAEYWYTEFKKETVNAEVQKSGRHDRDQEARGSDAHHQVLQNQRLRNPRGHRDNVAWDTAFRSSRLSAVSSSCAGKPMLFSLVRFQRDPQRMLNFYKTAIAERIGLLNRAPYLGYTGSIHRRNGSNANSPNYAYLEASPVGIRRNGRSSAVCRNVKISKDRSTISR